MSPLLITVALLSAGDAEPVDFDTQIVPILTRYGCNSGACHGSAAGRGGFNLSLYGSDPERDFEAIVFDLEGRRVNRSRADESLLFLKATESLSHGGGPRFEIDSEAATLLQRWIREGARRRELRRLENLELRPQSTIVDSTGQQTPIRAMATFDDGSTQDVTRWSTLTPDDKDAVSLTANGIATVHRRGRHLVQVRYLDRVMPAELIVPINDTAQPTTDDEPSNFIDQFIEQRLTTLRLPGSPPCDDVTFIRRACIRLKGRLPDHNDFQIFTQSGKPDPVSRIVRGLPPTVDGKSRRETFIEDMTAGREFTEYWTHWLSKLLRLRAEGDDDESTRTYFAWLQSQIRQGTPFDHVAGHLLTATGSTKLNGPPNFYRYARDPRKQAEFVSEVLMGMQLRCANCHDHPLDRWTQDDYHGLAAVFARVEVGPVISLSSRGEVIHPRTGEPARPRIPGSQFVGETTDARRDLMAWLIEKDNPYFDRAIVNRLWKAVMGRGLVEPVDDLRDTNPGTHPELLKRLAEDFAQNGRDIRHTLRRICTSSTFSRSSVPIDSNQSDDQFYSHFLKVPLAPEVLADAISDVTGVSDKYGRESSGTRAVNLYAGNVESKALDVLGRCSREESCESSPAVADLPRALHLINGPLLNDKIKRSPRIEYAIKELSDAGLIRRFYIDCLSRLPTDVENQFWIRSLSEPESAQAHRELIEDFVWSLLMSQEFVTSR